MYPLARSAHTDWWLLFAAWLVAAVSTLGALFFSEVLAVPPCTLCWYQRIAMFPLVLILAPALFPLDRGVVRYALPLSVVGLGTAIFHWLLQLGLISPSASPCAQGSSCAEVSISWFGWLTIPLLSVLGFALICLLLIAVRIPHRS
ncbi:disulfide bond formation protein B [Chitinibacter sp. ZOR0017]|uniref:disulfide bond formation protein B n=1 Tax=Chitinibacter sp. ZOR0017 TaxID=1339254 RepID=UPI0006466C52|nr:disulfide bond formation protein B [Chitinibacter sp. ZOR0017]